MRVTFKKGNPMLKTYFKLAYRNILKDKAYSFLNIAGLSIGLAASILILLWVQNENSYDKFHTNANQLYRINTQFGNTKYSANSAGMPAGLKVEIPAVKNTVRIGVTEGDLLAIGARKFQETKVFYVDPSFLDMFSYPLLQGDRATALSKLNNVLLTKETAIKYFGKEDPIGKILRKDDSENVVVTGVLANIPSNSDLQFDVLFPMASLARSNRDLQNDVWTNFNFYNYIQLDKAFDPTPANLSKLEKQMFQLFAPHAPGFKVDFQLQPLTGIHLAPGRLGDQPGHG